METKTNAELYVGTSHGQNFICARKKCHRKNGDNIKNSRKTLETKTNAEYAHSVANTWPTRGVGLQALQTFDNQHCDLTEELRRWQKIRLIIDILPRFSGDHTLSGPNCVSRVPYVEE